MALLYSILFVTPRSACGYPIEKVTDPIFFRRIEPERMIQEVLDGNRLDGDLRFEADFLSMAELMLSGYSDDEQNNIYRFCLQLRPESEREKFLPPFYLLIEYANRVFEGGEPLPVCRYDEVLNWRETYLLLGQDIFTTAWLAGHRNESNRDTKFSWPAAVPVNHSILGKITEGVAENHMHLYAGASTFALTWACLMNHPETIVESQDFSETLMQMHSSRNPTYEQWTQRKRMMYAAYIRSLLFGRLHGEDPDILERMRRFHASYATDGYMCQRIRKYIDYLRFTHGIRFPQPGGHEAVCLDYAFSRELAGEAEEHSRLLAGERYFLYACFRACFLEQFDEDEQWLFYIYLLLKSQFRSEFIQVNRQTGFHNFSLYDKRKKVLWERLPEY